MQSESIEAARHLPRLRRYAVVISAAFALGLLCLDLLSQFRSISIRSHWLKDNDTRWAVAWPSCSLGRLRCEYSEYPVAPDLNGEWPHFRGRRYYLRLRPVSSNDEWDLLAFERSPGLVRGLGVVIFHLQNGDHKGMGFVIPLIPLELLFAAPLLLGVLKRVRRRRRGFDLSIDMAHR